MSFPITNPHCLQYGRRTGDSNPTAMKINTAIKSQVGHFMGVYASGSPDLRDGIRCLGFLLRSLWRFVTRISLM